MVSNRCRSLVLSLDLYETRSQLGFTEDCVYVQFETHDESKPLWFILRRVKGKSAENRLIPISSFPTPRSSSVVAFGGGIYVIGGLIESEETSLVSFLDCRTHKWSYLPSMRIARHNAGVGVLDGKIYVIGGCDLESIGPSNWVEMFDPKMKTWSGVNIQDPEIKHCNWNMDVVNSIYEFQAEESIWNDLSKKGYCDVKRLLYCCDDDGEIMWCEPWSEVRLGRMNWRNVYGLEPLEEFFYLSPIYCGEEMADVWHCYMLKLGYRYGLSLLGSKLSISGDNIVMFWYKIVGKALKRCQIWCTEISMERREGDDIWGTVHWSNLVYIIDPFPDSMTFMHSVSVKL